MKNIFKPLLIGLFILMLPVMGYMSLTKHIYNRTDCEQFNIDNIEVRTGINIPKVDEVICEFKTTENTKVSVFRLSKLSLDFTHYVKRNGFIQEGDFYVNRGERTDTKWEAKLNEVDLKLVVSLVYK